LSLSESYCMVKWIVFLFGHAVFEVLAHAWIFEISTISK
jgi:hypothetical protein